MVKLETRIIETLNYFSGIIISVKTRSERQLLRLKQINMQLAAKIQHLEFSCSEKVRKHFREIPPVCSCPPQHSASHARPSLPCALSQEHLSRWPSLPCPCLLPRARLGVPSLVTAIFHWTPSDCGSHLQRTDSTSFMPVLVPGLTEWWSRPWWGSEVNA